MSTLVFSDTHLTPKFDPLKFKLLSRIISESDQVIINGDFWDGWLTNFDDFLNSPWNQLFPLLLRKQTVYVYGNHDAQSYSDARINLFCSHATNQHHQKINQQEFIFTHGHFLTKNRRTPLGNLYSNTIDYLVSHSFTRPLLANLSRLGNSVSHHLGQQLIQQMPLLKQNNQLMKQFRPNPKQAWLTCGDSHIPELDIPNKYANSGYIGNGFTSYLTISTQGIPTLHS